MDDFSTSLKTAREARGIALAEIAEATHINVQYLEAIERGEYTILPQTYVRAFIREYAANVGLDPAEALRAYERVTQPPKPEASPAPAQEPARQTVRPGPAPTPNLSRAAYVKLVAGTGAAALLIVLIWNFSRVTQPPPEEIPFQSVVRENEQRAAVPPDSSHRAGTTTTGPVDSLTLTAGISDTVWMQLVIDTRPPVEYLFMPNRSMSWKAAEKFSLTIGNAGAVSLTLNKKSLGTLGKPGAVVRNVELTRATLQKQ